MGGGGRSTPRRAQDEWRGLWETGDHKGRPYGRGGNCVAAGGNGFPPSREQGVAEWGLGCGGRSSFDRLMMSGHCMTASFVEGGLG